MTYSGWSTIVAGLSLIVPTASVWVGGPTIFAPVPVHIMVLAILIGPVATVLPTLLFWAWNPGLLDGCAEVPRRSLIALAILSALSILHYVGSWSLGLRYQGRTHTIAVGFVTLGFLAVLAAAARLASRRPSWRRNLAFHWLLFLWFGWYAIPSLGEFP